ncbi:MAG: MFS transporter [Pseudomonadota bacterium]|nr:MFS transporter [Pseudomonadota bacterium]
MADYFLFQGIIVLINVLLQLVSGFIGDKVARKHILVVSYALFLGRIFCWLCWKGPFIVFVGEILYAVSKALFDTVESPLLYDILTAEKKQHKMVSAYSKLNFAISLGTAIAALTGAWMYEQVGVQILLGCEFVFITTAILMAIKLPLMAVEKVNQPHRMPISEMIHNSIIVLKNPNEGIYIIYSGLLVACSHFFFWSFQPLMKLALVPTALFGIVLFTNNMMRSFGSLLTHRLLKYLCLEKLGVIVLAGNVIGLLGGFVLQKWILEYWGICLIFIFYLCLCIVLQLMFTIAQISRLQRVVAPHIRAQASATNMLVARFCTAILLIIPKYLTDWFSLPTLYLIYGLGVLILGYDLGNKLRKRPI